MSLSEHCSTSAQDLKKREREISLEREELAQSLPYRVQLRNATIASRTDVDLVWQLCNGLV
jgi:hypothetical protein